MPFIGGGSGTGTVTSVGSGTGLSGGPITATGSLTLSNTAVTPGSYTLASVTVDAQGRVTSASNGSAGTGSVTNVATGTGLTGGPVTSTGTIALANTAVTAGSYTHAAITVDAQGRLTAASSGTVTSGTVTSVATGTGLSGGPVTSTGTISLANTAVTAGTYQYPQITIDAQGRVTSAASVKLIQGGDLNYYVSPSGSDSNPGSVGSPWLTLQHACDYCRVSLDPHGFGFTTTVHIADGTYAGFSAIGPVPGETGGGVIFLGNTTTPSNVIINSLVVASGANIQLGGCRFTSTAAAENWGDLVLNDVEFAATTGSQIYSSYGANIYIYGAYSIVAGGCARHYRADTGGTITITSNCTITGAPNFTTAFAGLSTGSILDLGTCTFTGSATGTRYSILGGSNYQWDKAIATLPGNTAGTYWASSVGSSGAVLQVKAGTKTDTFSTTSTAWVDVTGLTVSITPTSSSNRVLIQVSLSAVGNDTTNAWFWRVTRGGTAVGVGDAAGSRTQAGASGLVSTVNYNGAAGALSFIDTPATTAATTYTVQVMTSNAANTVYVNRSYIDTNSALGGRFISTILATEITP